MSEQHIVVTVEGPIATVRLNRPAQGNALTPEMMVDLVAAFTALNDAGRHPGVRCIVLTGTGKYFCTGMDLKAGSEKAAAAMAKLRRPYEGFECILRSDRPVVCALNGPALGGGVGLLFCCDVRVAVADAFIAFPEVAVGLYPAIISGYILPRLGPLLTKQLMLTGERFSVAGLLDLHAVMAVAPRPEFDAAVAKATGLLLRGSVEAQAGVKRLVRLVTHRGEDHDEVMAALSTEFGRMVRSDDARHGAAVFKATGKAPDWHEHYAAKHQRMTPASLNRERAAAKSKL